MEKSGCEFNFVFKNGDTSNASMSGSNKERKTIYPENSLVRKVIVNFDKSSYVYGFRLFD